MPNLAKKRDKDPNESGRLSPVGLSSAVHARRDMDGEPPIPGVISYQTLAWTYLRLSVNRIARPRSIFEGSLLKH